MKKTINIATFSVMLLVTMAWSQQPAAKPPVANQPGVNQPVRRQVTPAAPVTQRVTPPGVTRRTTTLPAPGGITRTTPGASRLTGGAAAGASEPSAPGTTSPAPLSDEEVAILKRTGKTPALKFSNDADVEMILKAYEQATEKTLLIAPTVQTQLKTKVSPLTSQKPLTTEEYLDALSTVLSMYGVVLEPFGDKFIKVLPLKTVRTDGIRIQMESPDGGYPEKGQVVSQMIQLKSIAVTEAQKAIEGFKRPDGLIQVFERTNSLLVTDSQENVNRMLEIIKFIDQPLLATEEVNVRSIQYAKAEEIKKRLEEIVAESQKQTQAKEEVRANTSGAPGFTRTVGAVSPITGRPLPPGLARLTAQQQQPAAEASPNEVLETLVSDADRGMIRGKVQIVADERSNQIIVITREENMNFFDRIINVLDVETAPDVKVEVQRLEYADAEEVSSMLNDLIGNATTRQGDAPPPTSTTGGTPARSTSLAEAAAQRTRRNAPASTTTEPSADAKSKLGQLSKDNIKILADKRTNAIVMMGSPNDLTAITEIINSMDIKLSQVLIETVVLQVGLDNSISTGIDWVKRAKSTMHSQSSLVGYNDDGTPRYEKVNVPFGSYRYTAGGGGGSRMAQNLWDIGTNVVSFGSGLEYMMTIKNLRLDAVVHAAKTDGSSKILSSPVLLTVDNKEATLESKEMRYMFKGMRYMGYSSIGGSTGGYEPDVEQREIGLTVKITPRINPTGNVMLTIEETFEDIGQDQEIPGQSGGASQKWPTVITRKLSADVSVSDGETVILGGLVKTQKKKSESGIPILKDIPLIGKYLFGSTSTEEVRSELLVFLTPYVINTQADMDRETRRRKDYVNANDIWTKGWSESKLADPVSPEEMKRRLETKKKVEKAWNNYRQALEEHREVDENILEERNATEAVLDQHAAENAARARALQEAQARALAASAEEEEAPRGTLTVTESVEVLAPPEIQEQALLADGWRETAEAEVPRNKRSWWRFWRRKERKE